MCGRYRIKDTDALTEELRRTFKIPDWVMGPRYNIAPSQVLPVVINDDGGRAKVATMRWGLVPFWDKSEKPKIAPINARSEDAFAKTMFRQAIQKRRALVPADGFYEWKRLPGDLKQPFDICLKDGRPFFFAGIYEEATGIRPASYLLFTTRPNSLMAEIHNRMPAIITGERAQRWIAPGPVSPDQLTEFTEPFPAEEMVARPVSALVNNPRNDSPNCIAPIDRTFHEAGPH
jgi:putative SOS response-associated peptidase YedK